MDSHVDEPGNSQLDAFVQDTAADVFYKEIAHGTRKVLEPDLRKILDLDDKLHIRDGVIADLKSRLERQEPPKGFTVPKIPQVPAGVKDDFTSTFDDLSRVFIKDVTSALIKVRESDRTLVFEELVLSRTAYAEKFAAIGEDACAKMGITVSNPALLQSRLRETAATILSEERQKAKLKKVFDKLGKEKTEADAAAQAATAPSDMQQDDDVSLLRKQVIALEKKVNKVSKENSKGNGNISTNPDNPKNPGKSKPSKTSQKTQSKKEKKPQNGTKPPKKGNSGGSGKGKGAARGAK